MSKYLLATCLLEIQARFLFFFSLNKMKGERRPFWNGEKGNVNYYISVHLPIPTHGNREHPGNFQNKSVSSPFNWLSRYILFFPKLKWKALFGGCKKGHRIMRLSSKVLGCHKRWKFLSFFQIWNNPTPPLFFIGTLTNKHYRAWSSMINLWVDFRTYKK